MEDCENTVQPEKAIEKMRARNGCAGENAVPICQGIWKDENLNPITSSKAYQPLDLLAGLLQKQ